MNFETDKQYMYICDMHNSRIISYKSNNLATMNTVNFNISNLINRAENPWNIHESYLETKFNVSDNSGGIIANDANVRLVNNGVLELFTFFNEKQIVVKSINI